MLSGAASANADTIAEWTFETSYTSFDGITTADTPSLSAEIGTGTATGVHVGSTSGTTWEAESGDGSGHSLVGVDWSVDDYYQFSFSSDSYGEIQMTWDQTSSPGGPSEFLLEDSSNGGTSWTTVVPSYTVIENGLSPNPAWNTTTQASPDPYQLSFVFAAPASTSLLVRMKVLNSDSPNGNGIDSTGTDRIDNVTVEGVPEPATRGSALVTLAALWMYRRFRSRVLTQN